MEYIEFGGDLVAYEKLAGRKWKMIATLSVAFLMLAMFLPSTLTREVVSETVMDGNSVRVYIVSLDDVSNYRVSNRSMVVEGAVQASGIKKINVFLEAGAYELGIEPKVLEVNVTVTAHVISDWDAYRMLLEWGDNVIVVNAHDEYIPVPTGYTKEEWVDKIADAMLNRWGTWVHAGGYPFYRVWHQNGTTEEWGEQGFKTLMGHVGKGNVTCHQPPDWDPKYLAVLHGWVAQHIAISNWWLRYNNDYSTIATLHYSNPGYPINSKDFGESLVNAIYSFRGYRPGAIIRYSPNETTFNFGIYVHLGAWKFYDGGGNELASDLALGFVSTAVAIFADVGHATFELNGGGYDSALDAVQKAEREGRTVGLGEALALLENATSAYESAQYKMAIAYADQAKLAAQEATQPNTLPQTIVAIGIIIATISIGAYYKINTRRDKSRGKVNARARSAH